MKEKITFNKDFKDMTWDEFDKHTQMLIEKSENEMRLVESQTPEENKEMFFNEMKNALTKKNTLYSFWKKWTLNMPIWTKWNLLS